MEDLIKKLDKKVGSLRTTELICPRMENIEFFLEVKEFIENKDVHSLNNISEDMLFDHVDLENEHMEEIRNLLNTIILKIQ